MKSRSWACRGDNIFCGESVLDTLSGDSPLSFSRNILTALGLSGCAVKASVWMDALSTCMLAADPRIWPLKIVRLFASQGDVVHPHSMLFSWASSSPTVAGGVQSILLQLTELFDKYNKFGFERLKFDMQNSGSILGSSVIGRRADERFESFLFWIAAEDFLSDQRYCSVDLFFEEYLAIAKLMNLSFHVRVMAAFFCLRFGISVECANLFYLYLLMPAVSAVAVDGVRDPVYSSIEDEKLIRHSPLDVGRFGRRK